MNSSILSALKIIDPFHYPPTVDLATTFGEEELEVIIQHFCKTSEEEECSPLNPAELRNEFQLFRPFIIRNFPQTNFYKFSTMFLRNFSDMFPQMAMLISIALIIPVSSVPCERGFSVTNRIKTKLRNRLQIPTVDILLRISIEGPPTDQFDFSRALNQYKSSRQHRIFN